MACGSYLTLGLYLYVPKVEVAASSKIFDNRLRCLIRIFCIYLTKNTTINDYCSDVRKFDRRESALQNSK